MAANDKVVVTRSKLDALADKLKTIFGLTGKKTLAELTDAAGHYDPRPDISDATATAAQILKPYTAYVNGGKVTGEIESRAAQTIAPSTKAQTIPAGVYLEGAQTIKAAPLQNKTATPSKTQQSVKADAAYYGLDTVTVKAAPLQAKTVAPTTEAQTLTPDAGYIGFSEVKVSAAPLQTKTVTPGDTQQTISADSDYYGLEKVVVSAVQQTGKKAVVVQATPYDAKSFRLMGANDVGMSQAASVTIIASNYNTPADTKTILTSWDELSEKTFEVYYNPPWKGQSSVSPDVEFFAGNIFIDYTRGDFDTSALYTVIITGT